MRILFAALVALLAFPVLADTLTITDSVIESPRDPSRIASSCPDKVILINTPLPETVR